MKIKLEGSTSSLVVDFCQQCPGASGNEVDFEQCDYAASKGTIFGNEILYNNVTPNQCCTYVARTTPVENPDCEQLEVVECCSGGEYWVEGSVRVSHITLEEYKADPAIEDKVIQAMAEASNVESHRIYITSVTKKEVAGLRRRLMGSASDIIEITYVVFLDVRGLQAEQVSAAALDSQSFELLENYLVQNVNPAAAVVGDPAVLDINIPTTSVPGSSDDDNAAVIATAGSFAGVVILLLVFFAWRKRPKAQEPKIHGEEKVNMQQRLTDAELDKMEGGTGSGASGEEGLGGTGKDGVGGLEVRAPPSDADDLLTAQMEAVHTPTGDPVPIFDVEAKAPQASQHKDPEPTFDVEATAPQATQNDNTASSDNNAMLPTSQIDTEASAPLFGDGNYIGTKNVEEEAPATTTAPADVEAGQRVVLPQLELAAPGDGLKPDINDSDAIVNEENSAQKIKVRKGIEFDSEGNIIIKKKKKKKKKQDAGRWELAAEGEPGQELASPEKKKKKKKKKAQTAELAGGSNISGVVDSSQQHGLVHSASVNADGFADGVTPQTPKKKKKRKKKGLESASVDCDPTAPLMETPKKKKKKKPRAGVPADVEIPPDS
jgi:hypothetical protein